MEPSEEPMNGPDHPKDQQHTPILKGKRTRRRHRQQSPIPFASMMTGSPTSGGGEIVDTDDGRSNKLIGSTSDDKSGVAAADALSPSTSVELFGESCTKEEEDMANCLILLAQGQSQRELEPAGNIIKAVHQEADPPQDPIKFNSKRYLLEGYCVYECKTCNKTFPSFQALGGHRASHKKPKMAAAAAVAADERPSNKQIVFLPTLSDEEEGELKKISTLALLNHNSITYGANSTSTGNNKQPKIHECSICGAEFTSGQALGGHMRRHRSPTVAAMVTKLECDDNELPARPSNVNGSLTMLSLDLDLNLPAPDGGDDDDDSRENMFLISSERQHQSKQPPLLVSAPAIVDCRN